MTLEDLAKLVSYWHKFSSINRRPSPQNQLVTELRSAGYLSPGDDLAAMLRASQDRSKLDLPIPEDMVQQIWAMIGPLGFYEQDGNLRWAYASSPHARYSAAQAIDTFGMKLVIQASAERYGTPIPAGASRPQRPESAGGQGHVQDKPGPAWRRIRALRVRVWRRVPKPVAISLILLFAPLWVPASLVLDARKQEGTGESGHRLTGGELNKWLYGVACLSILAIDIAAWFAIWAGHLPPYGPAGRWVAIGLTALFAAQNVIPAYVLPLGFAMDGSNETRQPVAHPIRYLAKRAFPVLLAVLMFNAPLALILLVIGLIT